jgi:hypothetical protein
MRPAFDHIGDLSDQADAAADSRCTLIYATGIGRYSYSGLPPKAEMEAYLATLREYNRKAHARGVGIVLSYLCATSIVNIQTFAANWNDYFPDRPADFTPDKMLQQDIQGNNLPSWYGGAYRPADMWNPYWRQYTKLCVKLALESGHDGIFFDNPTVSMSGNFSPFAMRAWTRFLKQQGMTPPPDDIGALRALTQSQPDLWRRFRATESADFLREIRNYGRSLSPNFILTANNSLNSADSFYSQPQSVGYSIPDQSRNQDFITIEDMASQPRHQGNDYISYGSTLHLLHAIGNGRPLSICTTDGDYIGPPNLMGLAIAECTAHDAAYLVWSCWQPAFRSADTTAVARYHGFLAAHPTLFANTRPDAELLVVWPYENWLRRTDCPTANLARDLSAHNIQYEVVTEANLTPAMLRAYRTVVYAAQEGLVRPATTEMLRTFEQQGRRVLPVRAANADVLSALKPSVVVDGSPGVRAVARRSKDGHCLLHLYNLNVMRQDSYHERVTPAENVRVAWLLPRGVPGVTRVRLLTPDSAGTGGWESCTATRVGDRTRLDFVVPKLWVWTVVTLR